MFNQMMGAMGTAGRMGLGPTGGQGGMNPQRGRNPMNPGPMGQAMQRPPMMQQPNIMGQAQQLMNKFPQMRQGTALGGRMMGQLQNSPIGPSQMSPPPQMTPPQGMDMGEGGISGNPELARGGISPSSNMMLQGRLDDMMRSPMQTSMRDPRMRNFR